MLKNMKYVRKDLLLFRINAAGGKSIVSATTTLLLLLLLLPTLAAAAVVIYYYYYAAGANRLCESSGATIRSMTFPKNESQCLICW